MWCPGQKRAEILRCFQGVGFALGEFEESEEDGAAVVEEFYPVDGDAQDVSSELHISGGKPLLADKLRQKAGRHSSPVGESIA